MADIQQFQNAASYAFEEANKIIELIHDNPAAVDHENVLLAAELIRAAALFQGQAAQIRQASGLIMPPAMGA